MAVRVHSQQIKYIHDVSCMQRLHKRPVSPHVFEIDGKSMHYKMPINAISSITNRATGVALTTGEPWNRLLAATATQTMICMSVPFYLNSNKNQMCRNWGSWSYCACGRSSCCSRCLHSLLPCTCVSSKSCDHMASFLPLSGRSTPHHLGQAQHGKTS